MNYQEKILYLRHINGIINNIYYLLFVFLAIAVASSLYLDIEMLLKIMLLSIASGFLLFLSIFVKIISIKTIGYFISSIILGLSVSIISIGSQKIITNPSFIQYLFLVSTNFLVVFLLLFFIKIKNLKALKIRKTKIQSKDN